MERLGRKADNGEMVDRGREMVDRGREMSFEKVSSQIYLFLYTKDIRNYLDLSKNLEIIC